MTKKKRTPKQRETLNQALARDALLRATPEYQRFNRVAEIRRLLGPVEALIGVLAPSSKTGKLSEGEAWQISNLARRQVESAYLLAQCEQDYAWNAYQAMEDRLKKKGGKAS